MLHHRDMVVDTSGFQLLFVEDVARDAKTSDPHPAHHRCHVQGMKLRDPNRVLYSFQFHPELGDPSSVGANDRGFGAHVIHEFLRAADG